MPLLLESFCQALTLKGHLKAGLALVLAALCGCTATPKRPFAKADERREELASRSTDVFRSGILYKPAPSTDESAIWKMAPLLIEEAGFETVDQARPDAELGITGSEGLKRTKPALYAGESEVKLNGRWHPQLSFLWFYASDPARNRPFRVQGYRMTFNSSGAPVIWESLPEPDGMRVVFVARSLEQAAAAAFGKPLWGRNYSIERSLLAQPKVVVAGLVDDGPVPMGPIVYLEASNREITALLCRCTPAQVQNVNETRTYELLPITRALESVLGSTREAEAVRAAIQWLSVIPENAGLASCLRLPEVF